MPERQGFLFVPEAGETYTKETVQFGDGPVCLDQVVGVRPSVMVQELHEVPCMSPSQRSHLIALRE